MKQCNTDAQASSLSALCTLINGSSYVRTLSVIHVRSSVACALHKQKRSTRKASYVSEHKYPFHKKSL